MSWLTLFFSQMSFWTKQAGGIAGFNDSSHFGRVFTGQIGITPSRWRKQAREQSATNVIPCKDVDGW